MPNVVQVANLLRCRSGVQIQVGFGLINGSSTFVGYFNNKTLFVEEQQWYYLNHSCGELVHAFPKSIGLKINVIARLYFELEAKWDSLFNFIYLFEVRDGETNTDTETHIDH